VITLRREGEIVSDRDVRIGEYEPLEIQVTTSRDVRVRPDVRLDGVSIGAPELAVTGEGLVWRWIFRSESWCGRATLNIISDDPPVDLVIRAVPSGSKYSEDEYERMIERILSYGANTVWGLAPGQDRGSELAHASLGATHPVIVEEYLAPLLGRLGRILRNPVVNHRRVEVLEGLRLARPITSHILAWLSTRPDRLAKLRQGDTSSAVPQQVRQETYDHPANRFVKTLVRRLRENFDHTAIALLNYAQGGLVGDLEKARARHLADRLRMAMNKLLSALQTSFLRELVPGEMSEGVAQVFGDHPAYARFAKLARRLLDLGVRLNNSGDLASSLRRSYDLFEIYCLYQLAQYLETTLGSGWTYGRASPRGHVLCSPPEGEFWSAQRGDGRRWRLEYQKPFGHGKSGAITLTTSRKPDFVLSEWQEDRLLRWCLLDAKYRTAQSSINEALESMHIYRDSLRWRPDPNGEVQHAYAGVLIVPHVADEVRRFAKPSYLRQWGLGVVAIDDLTPINFLVTQAPNVESSSG
jgi:hypothetical protein